MESEYKCESCDRTFASQDALNMHSNAKHPKKQFLSYDTKKLIKKMMIYCLIILVFIGMIIGYLKLMPEKEKPLPEVEINNPENILVVKADDWTYGNPNASVILIEYLDFECESCKAYYPIMKKLKEEYKQEVLFVIRYYPLPGHPNSMVVARTAQASGKQGKFWQMHDLLFETQSSWGERKQSNSVFIEFAKKLGLEMNQFNQDFESDEILNRVARDKTEGDIIGVSGTPSFFLNGQKLINPKTIDNFRTLIDAAILQAPIIQNESDLVHEHADIAIYLDGVMLNLSQDQYQSLEDAEKNEYTHMHDSIGYILHKHKAGITLNDFFQSVNITFNNTCFKLENGAEYCNADGKMVRMFVNGTSNNLFEKYELNDANQILITYGTLEQANLQIKQVTDQACIFSKTCPERGEPPVEHCVGGLGTACN